MSGRAALELDEALRRVRLIEPMLRMDVVGALSTYQIIIALNETIGSSGIRSEFIKSFEDIRISLALKVALDISRSFDLSTSVNRSPQSQGKASIRVLAALLSRQDVLNSLMDDAETWVSSKKDRVVCNNCVAKILEIVGKLEDIKSSEAAALRRIVDFRNKRLAHTLFDEVIDDGLHYSDLMILLEMAQYASENAAMAISGLNVDFAEMAELRKQNAIGFAKCILFGLKNSVDE